MRRVLLLGDGFQSPLAWECNVLCEYIDCESVNPTDCLRTKWPFFWDTRGDVEFFVDIMSCVQFVTDCTFGIDLHLC